MTNTDGARRCSRCGCMFAPEAGEPRPYKTCPRCRDYNRRRGDDRALYNRERRAWLKSHGFCVSCGSTWAEPGHALCAACKRRQDAVRRRCDPHGARRRAYIQGRIDAGLCIDCGRPAKPTAQRCERCTAMRRDSVRKYKITMRIRREADRARALSAKGAETGEGT